MTIKEILNECLLLVIDMQTQVIGQQLIDLKQLEYRIGEAIRTNIVSEDELNDLKDELEELKEDYQGLVSDIEDLYNKA